MIGVFDSGLGGLTVLKALAERFDRLSFAYLGDHANVPYGDRPSNEIVDLTRAGVERLFAMDCTLVLLGCNTATAVAARTLQQNWLPQSETWRGRNVLGIVAPTVEAAGERAASAAQPAAAAPPRLVVCEGHGRVGCASCGLLQGRVLVLDRLRYRGNLGTIVRSAVQANTFTHIVVIRGGGIRGGGGGTAGDDCSKVGKDSRAAASSSSGRRGGDGGGGEYGCPSPSPSPYQHRGHFFADLAQVGFGV